MAVKKSGANQPRQMNLVGNFLPLFQMMPSLQQHAAIDVHVGDLFDGVTSDEWTVNRKQQFALSLSLLFSAVPQKGKHVSMS